MEQSDIQFQQDELSPKPSSHNKYGNLIVLYSSQKLFLSIGPHCNSCQYQDYLFIPTFILFIVAAVLLNRFVNGIFTNTIFRLFNAIFSIVQIVSYLIVALSNPGFAFADSTNKIFNNEEERSLALCNKCGARKAKKVRHCSYCNVCIRGYDHHCPWTSKCIGAQNFQYFNWFVGITPLYIMYYIIVMCVCLTG